MKTLIYQYYDGNILPGCWAGVETMKNYAHNIGSEYLFEENPRWRTNLGTYSPHYGQFKIVWDDYFEEYDKVLFADTDVFPVHGLKDNIFEEYDADLGICCEPFQPKSRQKSTGGICGASDEKWAAVIKKHYDADMPRTEEGLLKVYNSGVVMYSREGRHKARKTFVRFEEYIDLVRRYGLHNFYTADQNYLHAMLEVSDLNWVEMSNDWNSYIHYLPENGQKNRPVNDMRTPTTKFVHIQLRAADHYGADKLWRITNLPNVEDWGIYEGL